MKKIKRSFWLLPVLLAMLVTSCLKDDLKTIALLGTESNVMSIDSIKEFDTLLVFLDGSLPMDSVKNPPDIQGEFVFSQISSIGTNDGNPPTSPDSIFIRFGGEPDTWLNPVNDSIKKGDTLVLGIDTIIPHSDTLVHYFDTIVYYPNGQQNTSVPCEIYGDVKEKGNKFNIRPKTPAKGIVFGESESFTACFIVEYECELSGTDYSLTRGYIIKGTVSDEGFNGVKVACLNIDAVPKGGSNDAITSLKKKIYVYQIGSAKRSLWVKNVKK